ncbi:hypothetical protein C2G38_2195011 [Gigaspora rosea]|uniref:Uncharacterized protein n=1 Tax=Gigaspora rosea TaxID=44941 RepID=A0A397UYR6_9GLOM|nr:hypothetical protein C2G38_2195011 [Gigaspora rosea]
MAFQITYRGNYVTEVMDDCFEKNNFEGLDNIIFDDDQKNVVLNNYGNENVNWENLTGSNFLKSKFHQAKFQVRIAALKRTYPISQKIKIIIEPRNSKLIQKLQSSYFRIRIIGARLFSPQRVKSNDSKILIYESPLLDPGHYTLQVRLMFYDYPNIYSFETINKRLDPNNYPNIELIDKLIVNGKWDFRVNPPQNPWKWLNSTLPKTCNEFNNLIGRWTNDLKIFHPYKCKIPNYKFLDFPEALQINNKFRYNWIRFLGDSNSRALFQVLVNRLGAKCVKIFEGINQGIQYVCTLTYNVERSNNFNSLPYELILTSELYFPESSNDLEFLLNSTFSEICQPFKECEDTFHCDFTKSYSTDSLKICDAKTSDHVFISIGTIISEWSSSRIDKYLERIFSNIQEKHLNKRITFMTTNAINVHKIPKDYEAQYLIRNNFRINNINELLRKYLNQNKTEMMDLIDIWSTTQPIWEFSRDEIHFYKNIYNVHAQLVIDKLVEGLKNL